MRVIWVLSFLQMSVCFAFAQGQGNIWYFGDSAGINFNTFPATALTDGVTVSDEASSTICDANGNLLFYANGWNTVIVPYSYQVQVWNKIHQPMQNSSGIYGNYSMTQGVLILDLPGDSNQYYMFNMFVHNFYPPGLYYSIIDMSADSGKGAVTQKNLLLCDSAVTEKLTAVRHANGRDWWIIAHLKLTDIFLEYLLTPAGISGPYYYNQGPVIPYYYLYPTGGQLVFSKNGTKMCIANTEGQLSLFSFDRCTGHIFQTAILDSTYIPQSGGYYGCSFSPSGDVLYASKGDSLFQFDLAAPNIQATKVTLFTVDCFYWCLGQHRMGPDNKIYLTGRRIIGATDSCDINLSVINTPDSIGTSCNLTTFSFSLNNRKTKLGLSNQPNYSLGPVYGSICDSLSTGINDDVQAWKVSVYPNPSSTTTTFTFKNTSHEKVTLTVYDVLGNVFSSQTTGNNYFQLDWQSQPDGIYLFKIVSSKGVNTGKLMLKK